MTALIFTRNEAPTLGVEIEVQLVDAETLELKNCILDVLENVPADFRERIKPELMQSYLEINTGICQTVADVESDLREKIRVAEEAAAKCGAKLFWAATHPFSPYYLQKVTPNERYFRLVENLQETARRLVTFGLHVHVGVESGDKAVMLCDRLLRHLPTLLALSVNSPFWDGRNTGLHSQRSKVMEGLSTAGLPPLMRNWSEFVWLVKHLIQTHFIETIREIWWDVRPHHNFGTVEIRVCDMPSDLETVLGLTALIQCLVHALSKQIDEGVYLFDCHPMLVSQNKWRASRYGMEAVFVDPYTLETQPARQMVEKMTALLAKEASELDCEKYLDIITKMIHRPSGAQRQLDIFKATGNLPAMTRQMVQEQVAKMSEG